MPVTAPLAAVAAVLGVLAGTSATGGSTSSALWAATVAATVVGLAADARRWAWLVSATLTALVAGTWLLFALAGATLVLTFAAVSRWGRRSWIGAVAGVGVSIVLFRLPAGGFFGLQTVLATIAIAPLALSGLRSGRAAWRRIASWVAVVGGLALFGLVVTTVVAVNSTRRHVANAVDHAESAQLAVAAGNADLAGEHLRAAADLIGSARADIDSIWVRPARNVPVLGQHVRLLSGVLAQAALVGEAGEGLVGGLDLEALTPAGGQVDVAALERLEEPARAFATATADAAAALAALRSPWLVAPVAGRVAELEAEVADVAVAAEDLATAVAITPGLLGRDGRRQYLVLLATPAESRATVGFVSNWVVMEAVDGRLGVVDEGRVGEVNERLRALRVPLSAPAEYVARYGASHPERFFSDVTVSPDFPTVAEVAAGLFTAATGTPSDGVVVTDPEGVAALLELTGPVTVAGTSLDSTNVVDFLLRGQYDAFATDGERVEFLSALVEAVFTEVVTGELPPPSGLAAALAPAVDQDRLAVWSADPSEQAGLVALGLAGEFPTAAAGEDLVGLVTQNLGQNKIDVFLDRHLEYDVRLDDRGAMAVTATVTLTNRAPDRGLPDAVIGNNDQGLPFGTNVVNLALYSPHELSAASLDGVAVALQRQPELGVWAYGTTVTLGPGQRRVLVVELRGDAPAAVEDYVVVVAHQPLVNDDGLELHVRGAGQAPLVRTITLVGDTSLSAVGGGPQD
jgi:hypothetical protein